MSSGFFIDNSCFNIDYFRVFFNEFVHISALEKLNY